jgi:hypothetical protein
MNHKRSTIANLIILSSLIYFNLACSSFRHARNRKMTDEQYYAYLRKDTSICELPEIIIIEHFYKILDTVIITKERFKDCNEDLNPYVYSIKESFQNNNLVYQIEKLYSTLNLMNFHIGAFEYKGEIFLFSSVMSQIQCRILLKILSKYLLTWP